MGFIDDFMFDVFPVIFFIVFFGLIAYAVITGVSQWSSNNKQPILDVKCKVVSKRFDVSGSRGHTNSNGMHHSGHTSTSYYITFEVESGDRMEFQVKKNEYGMIAENDMGKLTFQGTRFLGFKRDV